MEMSYYGGPYYVHPELESLVDRLHPPRVCIDNDSYRDCTLVKVDSTNKHGILLSMVQVLTDLDFVISKSYISSDGRWFMDVFHVTDQLGNKITDKNTIHYIQQSICASRRGKTQVKTSNIGKEIRQRHTWMEHTTLEMTTTNKPGLLSEISAVLAELRCHVSAAQVWTHNTRAAYVIQVEDDSNHRSIMDPTMMDRVQSQLTTVVNAHHTNHQQPVVKLSSLAIGQTTHTERRLHQLMMADKDYENSPYDKRYETIVTVENCPQKGYSVVIVTSPDRPKLLFDTVCTLTDLQYVVFHATASSKDSIAYQEYYVRQKDGHALNSEIQRQAIVRCIIAAVERRVSHGLRLDVKSQNRSGLLSDVTRVIRENGLSIARAEIGIHGEKAVGSFHVTDARGHNVDPGIVEAVRKEIDNFGGVVLVTNEESSSLACSSYRSSSNNKTEEEQERSGSALGSWYGRILKDFRASLNS